MEKRLEATLSNLGYCTRKDTKKFLKQNEVLLNGKRVFIPSLKVKHEDILVNNEPLDPISITILMNKPQGTICSHNDAGALIYTLLPKRWQHRNPKISTVGRLDIDTTGAIILTDNGELNHKLTSPKSNISKIYEVTLAQALRGDEKEVLKSGKLMLNGEDKPLLPAKLKIIDQTKVHLEIVEGKYHQVKRMFAALGNRVIKLHRISFADFYVDDLNYGEYKFIEL